MLQALTLGLHLGPCSSEELQAVSIPGVEGLPQIGEIQAAGREMVDVRLLVPFCLYVGLGILLFQAFLCLKLFRPSEEVIQLADVVLLIILKLKADSPAIQDSQVDV